jgi:hypothetical protein
MNKTPVLLESVGFYFNMPSFFWPAAAAVCQQFAERQHLMFN